MNIDQMAAQFKSLKDLRQYCNSQYAVIMALNKKIVEIEAENKHLKEMLTKSTPILDDSTGSLEIYKDMSDELATCIMQIRILKDRSMSGELSMEEAKKLDIYTKLLIQLRTGKKEAELPTKQLSDDELLKMLNEEIGKQNG